MKKHTFYSEIAYFAGLILLGFGTAMVERAAFGMSMVIAPAYLIHLKVSQFLPFFSFGMAAYLFQAALLVLTGLILRRFRPIYLCSFATAVLYGFILDGSIFVVQLFPEPAMAGRILMFVIGLPLCSLGIAMLLHSYFPPEAYELFVKELSAKTGIAFGRLKMGYDLSSLLLALILSFVFFGFGQFKGVNIGTIVTALVNAPLISLMDRLLNRIFVFRDRFSLRVRFEGSAEDRFKG